MAKDDEEFQETAKLTEDQKWKQAPKAICDEIEELLEINAMSLKENYKSNSPFPSITLKMGAAPAGEMPKINIKLNIPRLKGQDERDIDLNQPRWFKTEDE